MCYSVVFNEGHKTVYQPLEEHIPSAGIQLVYEDGIVCEVTGKPRRTIIILPCDPDSNDDTAPTPARGYEGEKKAICNYYVEFTPSKSFCPTLRRGLAGNYSPLITAGKRFCIEIISSETYTTVSKRTFIKECSLILAIMQLSVKLSY